MRKRSMEEGNWKKRHMSRLAAGALSLALTVCAVPAGALTAYALEEAEAQAAMESTYESETEAPEDAVISAVTSSAVGAISEGAAGGNVPFNLLPEDLQQTLSSLDSEEMTEYAIMIERILKNPDFQSMLQYEEVRDLLITLIHNGLDMAQEDPILTGKVLETMGVNRGIIVFVYALLEARANSEVPEQVQEFLLSTKGQQLMDLAAHSLNPETLDQLNSVFSEAMRTYRPGGSAATNLSETEMEANTAETAETEATETEN